MDVLQHESAKVPKCQFFAHRSEQSKQIKSEAEEICLQSRCVDYKNKHYCSG